MELYHRPSPVLNKKLKMVLQKTTVSKPRYALSAVPELLDWGAHFVLAARWADLKEDRTQSKRPVWAAWLDRRPDFTAVKDHMDRDGLLGIVPASLGMAVLDVDTGDATQLIVDYPPWFLARSQRPGRVHLWYKDSEKSRRGGDWRGHGCAGEIIASTGYVVLWNTTLEELAESLRLGDFPGQGQVPFSAVAATVARWPSMPEAGSGKRASASRVGSRAVPGAEQDPPRPAQPRPVRPRPRLGLPPPPLLSRRRPVRCRRPCLRLCRSQRISRPGGLPDQGGGRDCRLSSHVHLGVDRAGSGGNAWWNRRTGLPRGSGA